MYRVPQAAPASQLPPERRGPVVGRFCKACGAVYPKFRTRHSGKSLYGRDHIASPCTHEGEPFEPGDAWWEPAVQPLPAPPAAVAAEGGAAD
jgi:hypothetical protein